MELHSPHPNDIDHRTAHPSLLGYLTYLKQIGIRTNGVVLTFARKTGPEGMPLGFAVPLQIVAPSRGAQLYEV